MNSNDFKFQPHKRTRRQNGVGVIEVLIALVLVSFGVLGMAGLQLTGMKHSTGGFNRSKATLFAENLSARMRTNPEAVGDLAYAPFDSGAAGAINCGTKPVPYCQASKGVAAQQCDSTQMAAFDLFSVTCGNWSSANEAVDGVADSLPNGRMQVTCDDSPCVATSSYTVLISWSENTGQDGNEATVSPKRVQVRFNP